MLQDFQTATATASNFFVLSIFKSNLWTNGTDYQITIDWLNQQLAAQYGDRFIDAQSTLFRMAFTDADFAATNMGLLPVTVRSTNQPPHLSAFGYSVVATNIAEAVSSFVQGKTAHNFSPAPWNVAAYLPQLDGTNYSVTLTANAPQQFFKLVSP